MPCIFLKPEPSTEVSAETVKRTEAPETAETNPGRFPHFGFHFGTVAAFVFFFFNVSGLGQLGTIAIAVSGSVLLLALLIYSRR